MTVDNFLNLIYRCIRTRNEFESRYGIRLTGEEQIVMYQMLAKDYDGNNTVDRPKSHS